MSGLFIWESKRACIRNWKSYRHFQRNSFIDYTPNEVVSISILRLQKCQTQFETMNRLRSTQSREKTTTTTSIPSTSMVLIPYGAYFSLFCLHNLNLKFYPIDIPFKFIAINCLEKHQGPFRLPIEFEFSWNAFALWNLILAINCCFHSHTHTMYWKNCQ